MVLIVGEYELLVLAWNVPDIGHTTTILMIVICPIYVCTCMYFYLFIYLLLMCNFYSAGYNSVLNLLVAVEQDTVMYAYSWHSPILDSQLFSPFGRVNEVISMLCNCTYND